MSEEEGGALIQILMSDIPQPFIDVHQKKMKHVGEPLLNWLYNGNICQCGYLVDSNFPLWVREEEKGLLMSRARMWLAFYKKIRTDTSLYTPMRPLLLFKLAEQYYYNKFHLSQF